MLFFFVCCLLLFNCYNQLKEYKGVNNNMNKNIKLLISEFCNEVNGLNEQEINNFFNEEKFKSLKSYNNKKDEDILKDYINQTMNIKIKKSISKSFPQTNISLLLVNESLNRFGEIISFPYYCGMDQLEEIKLSLIKNNINTDNSTIQLNDVLDKKAGGSHSIEFMYYIYLDDSNDKLTKSILEFDFKKDLDNKLIYSKFIKTVILNTFDKDILKKLNKIKGIINEN